MSLSVEWFSGLNPEEKSDALKTLSNSKSAFRLLDNYLDTELRKITAETIKDSYDLPSWAYKQADLIGATRTIMKLKKMINQIIE